MLHTYPTAHECSTKHHPASLPSGHSAAPAHHPKLLKGCLSHSTCINSNGQLHAWQLMKVGNKSLRGAGQSPWRWLTHTVQRNERAGTFWTEVTSHLSELVFLHHVVMHLPATTVKPGLDGGDPQKHLKPFFLQAGKEIKEKSPICYSVLYCS